MLTASNLFEVVFFGRNPATLSQRFFSEQKNAFPSSIRRMNTNIGIFVFMHSEQCILNSRDKSSRLLCVLFLVEVKMKVKLEVKLKIKFI